MFYSYDALHSPHDDGILPRRVRSRRSESSCNDAVKVEQPLHVVSLAAEWNGMRSQRIGCGVGSQRLLGRIGSSQVRTLQQHFLSTVRVVVWYNSGPSFFFFESALLEAQSFMCCPMSPPIMGLNVDD